jgi:hypothetical protein
MVTTLPLALTAKQLPSLESSSQLCGFVTTSCLRTLLLPMSEWRCIRLLKEYGVEGSENIGRYYSTKIIALNGELVDEVLVDKQCGVTASLRK